MVVVKNVQGPQYGSIGLLCLTLVAPVALVFTLWSVFGSLSPAVPVCASVGMLVLAWWIRRSSVVSVNDSGVDVSFVGGQVLIPWDDIERIDGYLLSGRLVRRSNGKQFFFSMLDPSWKQRPVTLAIRSQLGKRRPSAAA